VVQAGALQAVLVVEPVMLPAGVDTEVGREPTATAELDGKSSAGADEAGW
jgi:hypothetical protein